MLTKYNFQTGATQNPNESEEVLRVINIPIISQARCNMQTALTPRMICAGEPEGGRDSCSGDSGGPLACDVSGSYLLVGIVSHGIGNQCGLPDNPGIYAKVTAVRQWIYQITRI